MATTLLALLGLAVPLRFLQAQTTTSAVPAYISYQGKVSNSNGTFVGAGTPVNRLVIFRIWSHATNNTAAELLYSEQQTVTISEGEFSVLIGQGTAVAGTPLGFSEAAKGPPTVKIDSPAVFGGATRFLGLTVDDGTAAADPEVSPRQQLVTSGFAFRAKYAESVGSNGVSSITAIDNGNVGIGVTNPAAKLDVAGAVRAGGVTNPKFELTNATGGAIGAVGGPTGAGAFSGDAAANDLVVRAETGKLLLQSGSGSSAIAITSDNKVGIGTAAPTQKLDVAGTVRANALTAATEVSTHAQGAYLEWNKAVANTNGATHLLNQKGLGAGGIIFGEVDGNNTMTERMRIAGDGKVGIGTNAPTADLQVNGSFNAKDITGTSLTISGAVSLGQFVGALTTTGVTSAHAQGAYLEWNKAIANATGATFLLNQKGLGVGGIVFGEVDAQNAITERARFDGSGNFGIGTTTPSSKLHVNGTMEVTGFSKMSGGMDVNGAFYAYSVQAASNKTTHSQGGFLEWNKFGGQGATYLLNNKGAGLAACRT